MTPRVAQTIAEREEMAAAQRKRATRASVIAMARDRKTPVSLPKLRFMDETETQREDRR